MSGWNSALSDLPGRVKGGSGSGQGEPWAGRRSDAGGRGDGRMGSESPRELPISEEAPAR